MQPRVVLRHGTTGKWLHFASPRRILTARHKDEVVPLVRQVDEATRREGLYAAGFISYEAASAFDAALPSQDDAEFPLAWFALFPQVDETQSLPDSAGVQPTLSWQPSLTEDEFRRCLQAIREYIGDGDTYQVNFTHRLRTMADVDPWQFFLQITAAAAAPYAAFVDTGEWVIISASPELFFRLDGDQIESIPMKGTAARGLWFDDDQQKAMALRSSEKERAENVMIVDMVRNDLGRIALTGSVQASSLFSVEKYPTVWQMTSTVRARTQAPLDQILTALFPAASVTGAPKRRTMEIIAELETAPRRIYTGAIGFVFPERRAQFSVAIRTVVRHKPSGGMEYGVGGGIVWDSKPADEFEECMVKANVLRTRREDFDLVETMLWSPQKGYALLEYHLKRLHQSSDYFDYPIDLWRIRKELKTIVIELPPVPHRIRLVVSKNGALHCQAAPIDPASMSFADITLASAPVDASDVFLYHKTTHRRTYEDALRGRPGSADVLLFNEAGQITESTVANVAFEIDGVLYTPPLHCGLLPGVYRAWLLDRRQVQERVISIEQALRCPNVYLMNSVRGMHKVRIM